MESGRSCDGARGLALVRDFDRNADRCCMRIRDGGADVGVKEMGALCWREAIGDQTTAWFQFSKTGETLTLNGPAVRLSSVTC